MPTAKHTPGRPKRLTPPKEAAERDLELGDLRDALRALKAGDFSVRILPGERRVTKEVATAFNDVAAMLDGTSAEFVRVSKVVGRDGEMMERAQLKGAQGGWSSQVESFNALIGDLVRPSTEVARVIIAVAAGDLSQKMALEIEGKPVRGEFLRISTSVNTMVDQLRSFASEVTRVAKEVGTDGKLGGQAEVKMSGTWKDLTENVNLLADNLTAQVRNIALVTTAVANGDLSQKIDVEAKGELLELKSTVNKMVDQLSAFASEVTRVAKEVGVEGKLGGQAKVPGAAGTWRDLTDNVNQLANNLTIQVRAIMEVSIAVTQGDLTRSISVEAQGELLALRGNLNQMIANLRDTTQRNQEQDWMKTNLAKFSGMMQGQKTLEAVSRLIMGELTPLVSAHHGAFFIASETSKGQELQLVASYAYQVRKSVSNRFQLGEGLVGQSALEKKAIVLTNVPSDYIQISSGLGQATPLNILVLPILFEDEVSAVVELASFQPFSPIHRLFLEQLSGSIGVVLNMIGANTRTVDALAQSQSLAEELQKQSIELQQQQSELKKSNQELGAQAQSLKESEEQLKDQRERLQQVNEELKDKATLLVEQNRAVENKNQEVELSRVSLEEKAEQLALSSKYKSEFLANMSHELRTPLNSLLILSQLLADNPDGNLVVKQVEFANTIHAAGTDLLSLINDILDLSKIESGTMTVDLDALPFASLSDYVERNFGELARHKGLSFETVLAPNLPASISTDPRRLLQVLKNLLANAFKFTENGRVSLEVAIVAEGWSPDQPTLSHAPSVIAFSVHDTGIGVALDQQKIIFQAFQQADGTTSRKYGGTGLGLSISREIARLLGGEIQVRSAPSEGSVFTLYLPQSYVAPYKVHGDPIFGYERPPEAGLPRDEEGPWVTSRANILEDDRDHLHPDDRVLLVIEDDEIFASILLNLVRAMGFKCLVAISGEIGLELAEDYDLDGITLDLGLPGVDGWIVLDRLKHNDRTRHIPVHVISGDDAGRRRSLQLGALDFLTKPVTAEALTLALSAISSRATPRRSRLLIVEDVAVEREALVQLVGNGDVQVVAVGTAEEALNVMMESRFDCLVLDLNLPGMSGFGLIDRMQLEPLLRGVPVIVYTGRELTKLEIDALSERAEAIVVKNVTTMPHLLEQTSLFLHRDESNLPPPKRQMLKRLRDADPAFAGKTVLVIDDDVRNIFAVTAVLERQGMTVLFAENGRKGIEVLQANPSIQLVLMDLMMPQMDGYEATRVIRAISKYATLPIIVLTAKAMKDDRGKCIAAGASDYIAKPVEASKLLSVLRVWLH